MEVKIQFWDLKLNPITMIRELTLSQEISRIEKKEKKRK